MLRPALLFALGLTVGFAAPDAAHAQEKHEVRAVQYALARHGYDTLPADGKLDMKLRFQIERYAERAGVLPDFRNVLVTLGTGPVLWEKEWSAKTQQAVEFALRQALLDPDSAQFSDQRHFYVGADETFVTACVQVNAKNALGQYTGYQWYFLKGVASQIGGDDRHIFISNALPEYQAFVACQLGWVAEMPRPKALELGLPQAEPLEAGPAETKKGPRITPEAPDLKTVSAYQSSR